MVKLLGKKSKASTVVQFVLTNNSSEFIGDAKKNWIKRANEARKFFLLDIAGYFRKGLILKGVSLKVGDKKWEYARDLRIGILEESKNKDVIAIYAHSVKEKITIDNKMKTVLYFRPRKDSPEWVYVLIKWGPWPSYLLPMKVKSGDAIAISRRARTDEIRSLSSSIISNKNNIENEFEAAGSGKVSIDPGDIAVGMDALVDIGANVIRGELGFLPGNQVGIWRQVFKDTKEYAKECMGKVSKYIVNGDKNIFDLPDEDDTINESVIRDGLGFAKEIAKFLK